MRPTPPIFVAIAFLGAALTVAPSTAVAQASSAEIERALVAAPGDWGADATVLSLKEDGSSEVLRQGSNGLVCWDSSVYNSRFTSMCTSEANRPRVEQTHAVRQAVASDEDAEARLRELEERGEREAPQFGSLFFRAAGDDPATARTHTTISVPYATGESLGVPEGEWPEGRQPARIWLMQAGTSSAHLMLPLGM